MRTCILLIITLFLSIKVFSQSRVLDGVYSKSNEERIALIDQVTEAINADLINFTKTQEFSDSSNYKFIYKDEKELKLISIYSKVKDVSYVKEWYFQNEELIFAKQTSRVIEFDKVIDTERMYLDKENLFLWIQSGHKVHPASEKFKETAGELREYADHLRVDNFK